MKTRPSGYTSAISSIIGLALPLIMFLVATPAAIAHFGEGEFGLLLLLLSFHALLLSVDFGLSSGAVVLMSRHLSSENYRKVSQVLAEVVLVFLFVGLLVVISIYSIANFIDVGTIFGYEAEYVISLAKILSVSAFFGLLANALSLFLKSLEQFPTVVLIQNVYNTGIWICVLTLAIQGRGLIEVLWCGVALYGIQSVLYLLWIMRSPQYSFSSPIPKGFHLKEILGYSGYAFISQLSSMVTYHIDRILVGALSSVIQVSYYAVPANIVSRLLNVGALFNSFVFPRAVRLHSINDYDALRALYIKASRYTFLLLIPVLVPLLMYTPELLTLWLGEEFAAKAQLTARILLIAFFIAAISITPSQLYNGMGNSRIGAIYSSIGSLINVILCLILIPLYGAAGASFASLAAMLQAVFYRRALEVELGIERDKQRVLHFVMMLVAFVQALFCLFVNRFTPISDIYSAFFALFAAWMLFYLIWLMLPVRYSGLERMLCGRVIIRIRL